MSYRARNIVTLVVIVVVASAYGRLSRDWSFGTFYPVFLGVTAVLVTAALLWTQLGPGEKPHHKARR